MRRVIHGKRRAPGRLANLLMVRSFVMALLAFGAGVFIGATTTAVAEAEHRYDVASSSRVEHVRRGWHGEPSDCVDQRCNTDVDHASGGSSFEIATAIATVQKIAYSLSDKDLALVDVAVLPPFTDLRSVQTLIEGDKYKIAYGAQDCSQHAAGA